MYALRNKFKTRQRLSFCFIHNINYPHVFLLILYVLLLRHVNIVKDACS